MRETAGRRRFVVAAIATGGLLLGGCSSNSSDRGEVDDAGGGQAATTTVPAGASTTSPGCDSAQPIGPGTTDRTMRSGGEQREFQLIVPESYDGTTPLPVVFALHPDVISYTIVPPMVGFPDMTAEYEFIGVSPSGLVNGTIPYWMAVRTDPPGHDIAFLSDLLDLLETELCIDPSRVAWRAARRSLRLNTPIPDSASRVWRSRIGRSSTGAAAGATDGRDGGNAWRCKARIDSIAAARRDASSAFSY